MNDKKTLNEFYNFASLFYKGSNGRYVTSVLHIGEHNLFATNGHLALISKRKPEVLKDIINNTLYWKGLNKYLLTNEQIIFDDEHSKEDTKGIIQKFIGWLSPEYPTINKNVNDVNIEFKEGICKLNCEDTTWYLDTKYLTYALGLCDQASISKDPHNFTIFEGVHFSVIIMPLRGVDENYLKSHELDDELPESRATQLKDKLGDLQYKAREIASTIKDIRDEL